MSGKHQQRFYLVAILTIGIGIAAALILYALRQNIHVFYTPSQIAAGEVVSDGIIRVGGMVVDGSIKRQEGLKVTFAVTDYANTVNIHFEGILPDLFREGQGIVSEGRLLPSGFFATTVLAKHDENYMPKEVRDSLKDKA